MFSFFHFQLSFQIYDYEEILHLWVLVWPWLVCFLSFILFSTYASLLISFIDDSFSSLVKKYFHLDFIFLSFWILLKLFPLIFLYQFLKNVILDMFFHDFIHYYPPLSTSAQVFLNLFCIFSFCLQIVYDFIFFFYFFFYFIFNFHIKILIFSVFSDSYFCFTYKTICLENSINCMVINRLTYTQVNRHI